MRTSHIITLAAGGLFVAGIGAAFALGLRLAPLEGRSFDRDAAIAAADAYSAEIARDACARRLSVRLGNPSQVTDHRSVQNVSITSSTSSRLIALGLEILPQIGGFRVFAAHPGGALGRLGCG